MASYPQLECYARQYVESIAAGISRSMAEKVRQLAPTMLPLGGPTLAKVAQNLGMDERSVRRHLNKEGTGFNEVLNQMRCEVVKRYLGIATRKQTEIALLLGFSSASVFARWFRDQFGCTAVEWVEREQEAGRSGSAER